MNKTTTAAALVFAGLFAASSLGTGGLKEATNQPHKKKQHVEQKSDGGAKGLKREVKRKVRPHGLNVTCRNETTVINKEVVKAGVKNDVEIENDLSAEAQAVNENELKNSIKQGPSNAEGGVVKALDKTANAMSCVYRIYSISSFFIRLVIGV